MLGEWENEHLHVAGAVLLVTGWGFVLKQAYHRLIPDAALAIILLFGLFIMIGITHRFLPSIRSLPDTRKLKGDLLRGYVAWGVAVVSLITVMWVR